MPKYIDLMFGTTKSLRSAFEEQRPSATGTLKNAVMVKLHESLSHIRFTADEAYLIMFITECSYSIALDFVAKFTISVF